MVEKRPVSEIPIFDPLPKDLRESLNPDTLPLRGWTALKFILRDNNRPNPQISVGEEEKPVT